MPDPFDLGGSTTAAELTEIRLSMEGVGLSAERMSRTITRAFANAITSGKSFEQTLRVVALSLSRMALTSGLQPLMSGLTSAVGGGLSSLVGGGGVSIAPFADGGVVARPTFFGSGGGLGLMGERGAEAIMPLARGPDGRLGVAAQDHGRAGTQVHVTISTPDAESFRRSQVQVLSAIARAVMRGQRGL